MCASTKSSKSGVKKSWPSTSRSTSISGLSLSKTSFRRQCLTRKITIELRNNSKPLKWPKSKAVIEIKTKNHRVGVPTAAETVFKARNNTETAMSHTNRNTSTEAIDNKPNQALPSSLTTNTMAKSTEEATKADKTRKGTRKAVTNWSSRKPISNLRRRATTELYNEKLTIQTTVIIVHWTHRLAN